MNKDELEKIKVKALEEHIPIIMDDTLDVIANILTEKKPKRILEIGAAVGYSAMCFSEYLVEGGVIDTIERDENRIKEAKQNFKKVEVENKINLYEGDAVEILPTLSEKYDVVFIDAAKGKYPFFLKEALRMLNDNGVILADNILYKGYVMSDYNKHKQRTAVRNLREYIKETTEDPNLKTEILEVGDGLAISWKRLIIWEKGTVLFSHFFCHFTKKSISNLLWTVPISQFREKRTVPFSLFLYNRKVRF